MNILLFDYDFTYKPSAPFAEIEISSYSQNKETCQLWAMIDSGADATIVPIGVLKRIGAQYKESRYMSGTAHGRLLVDLYLISVKILSNGPLLNGIKAVGHPSLNEVVLGRDVLNQLEITLNGPGESVIIRND